jgi:hypothetical protein
VSTLAQELWRACAELGLHAELDFRISLPGGHQVLSVARIAEVGACNGMLIFGNDEVLKYSDALLEAGYGFSVLEEPGATQRFDLGEYKEMFSDWGWTGPLQKRPQWMT